MPEEESSQTAPDLQKLRDGAALIRGASRIAVLTGAGISAESGLATFRGSGSDPTVHPLWSRYDPMELATIEAYHRDPELVTRWYHWRFDSCKDAEPNEGHRALVELDAVLRTRGGALDLVTQNIDGLHQKAGSSGVIELHGTILTWRGETSGERVPIAEIPFDVFPPVLESGDRLRPDVVWFGESLPVDAIERAAEAAATCDVFMSVGTSGTVWPAAGFIHEARSRGAATLEVNYEPTPLSGDVDVSIRGRCGEVLPTLVRLAAEGGS